MESPEETKLEVISLQMPRTGSLSLYTALKQLGYDPVWHSLRTQEQPDGVDSWCRLAYKKFVYGEKLTKADLDGATRGLQAATSGPYWAFWEELMDFYPDAKIILVERKPDSWFPSIMKGAPPYVFSRTGTILRLYAQPMLGKQDINLFYRVICGYFDCQSIAQFKENAKDVFVQHSERIKRKAVNQGREILDLQLGEDGWAPLCKFLDKPIPEADFPHVNNARELGPTIKQKHTNDIQTANLVVAKYLGVLAAAGIAAWWYFKRR